jgi:hypothetical protein
MPAGIGNRDSLRMRQILAEQKTRGIAPNLATSERIFSAHAARIRAHCVRLFTGFDAPGIPTRSNFGITHRKK